MNKSKKNKVAVGGVTRGSFGQEKVIPVIFASSLIMFPTTIASFIDNHPIVGKIIEV